MNETDYCVYILTNHACTTLYVGITNDLFRRVLEHRSGKSSAFTARYHLTRLVYFEPYTDPASAIEREKQLKGGSRQRKVELVNSINPEWEDLFERYFGIG